MELSVVAPPSKPRRNDVTVVDRRSTVSWLVAVFIALLHMLMAVSAVNTKSPTFDEPQHLAAGFSYWKTNDFRLDPENGTLTSRWAAIPLLLGGAKFVPLEDNAWRHSDDAGVAHKVLYELGNDPDRMLAQARLMMSLFGGALCLLAYRIAREFFGLTGGVIAETFLAFDPNFLAHSPLVTADVPAAFVFTAATWTCWRLLQEISPIRLTLAILSLSALFLTKFSAPIIFPVLAVISFLQMSSPNEITVRLGGLQTKLTTTWKKIAAISATWIVLGLTVVVAIWATFSFRYSALTDNAPARKVWDNCWSAILSDQTLTQRTIGFARIHHLLPEAYLCGFAYTEKSAESRPSFLDNHWSLVGFSSFFPLAFLYKTPLPFLCLIAFAAVAAVSRRRNWRSSNVLNPFFLFALIYAAFAIGAQLNIGHRHILPIYPALFIGSGAAALLLQTNRRMVFTAAMVVLVFWQVGDSLTVRPNYLAYFNQIAGGPSRGYSHLVDSSLDWGQDLPSLKAWIDQHPSVVHGRPIYLSYFGSADPRWYGINAEALPENHSAGNMTFAPLRAGVFCISATTLQSVYAPEIGPWSRAYEQQYQVALANLESSATGSNPSAGIELISNKSAASTMTTRIFERLRFERLCAYLRHRPPQAEVGHSIFIFDLTEKEIDQALFGPAVEMTSGDCVTGY